MRINKMQREKHSRAKSALYGLMVASGLLGSSMLVVAQAQNDTATVADVVPLTRVNPEYPADALAQKLEGWVQLRFDLDAAGNVQNVVVVASCAGAEVASCKEGDPMFAESAQRALQGWTYAPNVSPRTGVETILRFQLTK